MTGFCDCRTTCEKGVNFFDKIHAQNPKKFTNLLQIQPKFPQKFTNHSKPLQEILREKALKGV